MWSPTRPLDARLDTSRDPIPGAERNTVLRSLDWILRGVGQVVFQGNWLSGIVILVGIGVTSRVYLVAAIVGTVVSTTAAVALGVGRRTIGALGGCAERGVRIPRPAADEFVAGGVLALLAAPGVSAPVRPATLSSGWAPEQSPR